MRARVIAYASPTIVPEGRSNQMDQLGAEWMELLRTWSRVGLESLVEGRDRPPDEADDDEAAGPL